MGMGLVCRVESSAGCWKRSESRVSCEGDNTALSSSMLLAEEGLPWGTCEGGEPGVKLSAVVCSQ